MRRLLAVALVLGVVPVAQAQDPWRSSYFPYVLGTPTDGAMLVLRWQRTQNAPYFLEQTDEKDVINPITFRGAVSVEGGAGTRGSRFLRVEARLPAVVEGWRFDGMLGAERQGRFGYYGVGADLADADPDAPNTDANRIHRDRWLARFEGTRTIRGPFRLAVGLFADRTSLSAVTDSGAFGDHFGTPRRRTSIVVRPALVVDTRDREFTPSRGVLLEAGAGFGSGREQSLGVPDNDGGFYGFGYAQFKGYFSPREGTVLAGRALVRRMAERAPLSARFGLPGWEREVTLSGADGHRGLPAGALAATDLELYSLEVRHDLLNAGDLGAVTLLGFADWARVEDRRSFRLGSADFFGAGAGVALRVIRSAILTTNFAGGPNGFNFSMGTNWSF
jgi:hypothetical protein